MRGVLAPLLPCISLGKGVGELTIHHLDERYGRGCGVGRGLATGVPLGLGVGVDVAVGVGVGEGVGVGSGCAQYRPPVFKKNGPLSLSPPQTIISLPLQTAV